MSSVSQPGGGGGAPTGSAGGDLTGTYPNPTIGKLGPIILAPDTTSLVAAIAALPATGGVIQLVSGTYSLTAGQIDLTSKQQVRIQGTGGTNGGSGSATNLEYTGTGSSPVILLNKSTACQLRDMEIRYTNAGFTGTLVQCGSKADGVGQDTMPQFDNVLFWGNHSGGQTARLIDLDHTIQANFNNCIFNGAGEAIRGATPVAVTGVSVANPTVITAPSHGFTTGQQVSLGGMVVTATGTPLVTTPMQGLWTITVVDANTFTVPCNVTAVTSAAGFAYNPSVTWSNAIQFTNCQWINQVRWPIYNAGQSYTLTTPTFQARIDGSVGIYAHDAGVIAEGFAILGGWCGDQTTSGTTEAWINWHGTGLSIINTRFGGKQNTTTSAVKLDGDACSGIALVAPVLDNMIYAIEFGTTVNHRAGVVSSPSWISPVAGYLTFHGSEPIGIQLIDTSEGTHAPFQTFHNSSSGKAAIQFENDTACRLYRTSAGTILAAGTLVTIGRVTAGYSGTGGTQIYGTASETVGGTLSVGSNANIDNVHDSKGTGVVKLDVIGTGTGGVMVSRAAGKVGFYGTTPIVKATVSGSKGANAALTSLLTTLANLGLLTDSST